MSRNKSRHLYDLIKSMNRNEKRYFKVLFDNTQSGDDKKMLQLFDVINKSETFDEEDLVDKIPGMKPAQISNLKAYLSDKILISLRQYNSDRIIDIRIREQIDFAQLLFERRLYLQGKTCLKKALKLAQEYNHLELQLEILKLEKSIMLSIMEEDPSRPEEIIREVKLLSSQINNITIFSNLTLKLNSYYTKIGFIRNEQEYQEIETYFHYNMPQLSQESMSYNEKIHLYKLYVGYYFFIQDFENGYLYSNKLYQLYQINPQLKETNLEGYITALNTLLTSQYKLNKYDEFVVTNKQLHSLGDLELIRNNESIRFRLQKYYFTHEINIYFMMGNFDQGIKFITEEKGEELNALLELTDKHSAMILNYKIACLYIGAGNFNMAIRYLNRIINEQNVDFREDLHCFSRMLNLVCHFELGNFDVIKYYIISTYRFLFKKDDLHSFQKSILGFLKNLKPNLNNKELIERFSKLKTQLVPLENSAYEKRAFVYFDIISWLESKIEKKPVQEIMMQKFLHRKND